VATPACAAALPATPRPSAVDALCRRCDVVISGELTRLARRSPTLDDHELEQVSTSIHRVVERLLLNRVRERPSDHLATLFDLEETT
jgi:hypothetical protein